MVIFHSYVSLPEGKFLPKTKGFNGDVWMCFDEAHFAHERTKAEVLKWCWGGCKWPYLAVGSSCPHSPFECQRSWGDVVAMSNVIYVVSACFSMVCSHCVGNFDQHMLEIQSQENKSSEEFTTHHRGFPLVDSSRCSKKRRCLHQK